MIIRCHYLFLYYMHYTYSDESDFEQTQKLEESNRLSYTLEDDINQELIV